MPQIVDLTNPQGKYGGSFNAIADILETIGKVEGLRQERSLNAKVINIVSQGGGPQEIAQALSQNQPQYSTGSVGFLQKIASSFAPPSQMQAQVGQGLMQQAFQDPLDREYKQARIESTKALTDKRLNPTKGRSYQTSWFDKDGKKRQALVPEEQYGEFQGRIEAEGGTLKEPDSLEDQYRYWQEAKRRATGSDTATVQSQILAQATGQSLPITRDVEGEQLANDRLAEIRKKMGVGKAKKIDAEIEKAGSQPPPATQPKTAQPEKQQKRVYGVDSYPPPKNKAEFDDILAHISSEEEKDRWFELHYKPEYGKQK
ncbi:MAG: hypothetical protein MUO31_12975 [Thermodesulfovibrionales bacterium]|nr:hypothetical protein [Thermodesulfovibrionales bacterium]